MELRAGRVHRTVAEKRRIVELTLAPGMSVARVAQAEGVNSHQVFQWRRAFRAGGLMERSKKTAELLPVVLTADGGASQQQADMGSQPRLAPAESSGTIHIEMVSGAKISVERGADALLLRTVVESLRR